MRRLKDYFLLYLKGIGMGAADVIPGVSGGTIALVTGIYREFITAVHALDMTAVRMLLRMDFREFWKKVNGNFLLAIFSGMVTSVLGFLNLVNYLIRHHHILVNSFFFGLMLISGPLVLRHVRKWTINTVLVFILGIVIAYFINALSPLQPTHGPGGIFLSGVIAISSMVIPGVSGVFIILLLGKYPAMSLIWHEPNLLMLLVFFMGCVFGIIVFSRFLAYILTNYHGTAVALLAGLMLGSLNKVWPWREILEYVTNSQGQQVPVYDRSVLPWHYFVTTGKDPRVFQAIMMMALGVFIVVLLEKIAARLKTRF